MDIPTRCGPLGRGVGERERERGEKGRGRMSRERRGGEEERREGGRMSRERRGGRRGSSICYLFILFFSELIREFSLIGNSDLHILNQDDRTTAMVSE